MTAALRKQRRTQAFNIRFTDKLAEGWVFSVHEAFKDQLDIRFMKYIDKEKSKELRKVQPVGNDGKRTRVMRGAWSRGVPPLLCFNVGHTFYEPSAVRNMTTAAARLALRRTVQVTEAKADEQPGTGGWVKIKISHYEDGDNVGTDEREMSQADFEVFLRFGKLPFPSTHALQRN